MPEIIGAKCYGCGAILRVPSSYGGKKAKCPRCKDVIIIPSPSDSTHNLITDDMLPVVAKDSEAQIVEAELLEEEVKPPKSDAGRARRVRGTAVRGKGSRGAAPRLFPARKKSSAPLVIGIIVAVCVLVTIVMVLKSGSAGPVPSEAPRASDPDEGARTEVRGAFDRFVDAYNKSDLNRLLSICAVESEEERKKLQAEISDAGMKARVELKNVRVDAITVSGATARVEVTADIVTTTFQPEKQTTESNAKRSYEWVKKGEDWKLVTRPIGG